MRNALITLISSVGLLACGLAICMPGICGCAGLLPAVDGDRYIVAAISLDVIGLIGIAGSLVAMPVVHLVKLAHRRKAMLHDDSPVL